MSKLLSFILLMTVMVFAVEATAQERQLAAQYYHDGQYDKALELYEKIYGQSKSNEDFYYYIRCLIKTGSRERAIDVVEEQIRRNGNYPYFYVETGSILVKEGLAEEGTKLYEDALEMAGLNHHMTRQVANAFLMKREYGYAEKVYLKARTDSRNEELYRFDLANVYMYQRKYDLMINEYFELLSENQGYIQSVQNHLQRTVYRSRDDELPQILKDELLKRIQAQPGKTVFAELLIWLLIQERDFPMALRQAKALDRRLDEDGNRVIYLSRLALANEDYDAALEGYQYVIDKGRGLPYYYNARNELLQGLFRRVMNSGSSPTQEQLAFLDRTFQDALAELGITLQTIETARNMAHLKAFYRDQPDTAIILLDQILRLQDLPMKEWAKTHLEKGDVYLIMDDPWTAILEYGKVEKKHPDHPLGHEARFRKAKTAFYVGDFQWSRAQLDVLKGSTEKLIANNAAELALLIKDNTLDTILRPLQLYSQADMLLFRNKDSLALATLDSIIDQYPGHTIVDESLFLKGRVYENSSQYTKAVEMYAIVAQKYPLDLKGDNALFRMAWLYHYRLNDQQKAMEYYEKILLEHQNSIFVNQAREAYRQLRDEKPLGTEPEEDFIEEELPE